MAIKRTSGGTPTDITIMKRRSGGSWVDVALTSKVFRRSGGSWVDALPSGGSGDLSATVSPASASGLFLCNTGPSCPTVATVGTTSVTVTSSGGSGAGPTFSWARISGDSAIVANSPTSASTTFSANVPRNTTREAVFRCTVTRGVDSVTVDVTVAVEYIWGDS